jgi:hypothetical protein
MIANAGPEDVQGGTAGFDALTKARQAWASAMKMSDLERIQARADMMDNPATGIKSGIRTLLSNPARARGYSDAEIQALKTAADRGYIGGALHVFGSRLLPLMGAVTGAHGAGVIGAVVGGGVSHGLGEAVRGAAGRLQSSRLRNAMDAIGANVPEPPGYRPPPAPESAGVPGLVPWVGASQPQVAQ